MNLILLAPPGGGKGTQSSLIYNDFGIHRISTGDLLRKHKEQRTKIGKEARKYMDAGELVPDYILTEILKTELIKEKYKSGFLLDGYPRTLAQAIELESLTENINSKIDLVIILDVPAEELLNRLGARRICKICERVYNLKFHPPDNPNKCNEPCGGKLYQRDDDKPETIINRLKIYESKTRELLEYYSKMPVTQTLDGTGKVQRVYDRVKDLIEKVRQDD
ncbi:MAG: adenylate kinase [Candidatus Kapabacteria bacterium]|nr:adenylate kinase [Ignavibacteriota bacterium]MCW5884232.1 adenylate kinase [Candidatus Kapabacteria bacterium]